MSPTVKIPVIIDTDPGVDDVIAILFALTSPELEILAFIISFGNTDVKASYPMDMQSKNILKIYQAISVHLEQNPQDATRFPNFQQAFKPFLVLGATRPLEGAIHSAQYFHGRDGLSDITNRHPDLNVDRDLYHHPQLKSSNLAAPELILHLLNERDPRTISYIALGPLTNLAQVLRLDKETFNGRIGRVVCMGGAFDVPGNTSPVAEFNWFADPYAVKELLVLSTTTKTTSLAMDRFIVLPLDITTPHELPFPVYKSKVDPTFDSTQLPSTSSGKPHLTHFTSSFLERTREVMLEFGNDAMELHDIVAVWYALDNPPVNGSETKDGSILSDGWKTRSRSFDIERTGEITRGMVVVDRRDDQSAYDPGANRAMVQAELEKHLHGQKKVVLGPFESTARLARVEVELEEGPRYGMEGGRNHVCCVTETPGPEVLLKLLLKRVWGVE